MKYFVQSILIAGGFVLSACGGGSAETPMRAAPAPAPVAFKGTTETVSSPAVVTQTSAASRLIAKQSGSGVLTWTAGRSTRHDTNGFIAFGGGSNNPLLFEADTATGARAELSMIVNDTGPSPVLMGGKITTVDGTMPQAGTATYAGDYVGFVTRSHPAANSGLTDAYIKGDVRLNADFAADTISGSITNRTRHLTSTGGTVGGESPGDIALGQINFDQTSSGRTTGGDLLPTHPSYVPANGTMHGNWRVGFSGANAAEALGTVSVRHDYLNGSGFVGDDYTERGVFTATKQ